MGNWFSKKSTQEIKTFCDEEEPELRNLAEQAKIADISQLKEIYLKSLTFIKCNNSNSKLLKSQIYNLYQDLLIQKAVEELDTLRKWKLPEYDDSKKEEENNKIQLDALQDRTKELSQYVEKMSISLKDYTRKDTQATEIIDVIKTLQDEAMKSINIASKEYDIYCARYLFGIIVCNYTTGSISADEQRTISDLKNYLTLESYKGCLMFSEFIPLLWMTEYAVNEENNTAFTFTDEYIQQYLDKGDITECLTNLSKYYQTYFWPKYLPDPSVCKNCELTKLSIPKTFEDIYKIVSPFVDNKNIKTWDEFYKQGKDVLNKLDTHHIKMLPYMAQKKNFTTSGEIMKVPETWPKYDKDIELYEAILSVMNICFASYGGEREVETVIGKENASYYVPKNRGSYTYKDLGLYSLNSMYFDQRPFLIIPNDAITISNKTSKCVKASELDVSIWKNFKLKIDADVNDINIINNKNRKTFFNNTGYFTDRIFNCNDISEVVTDFPIIPGLSAYKPITKGQGVNANLTVPKEVIKKEKEKFEKIWNNDENLKQFISNEEMKNMTDEEIHQLHKECFEGITPEFGKTVIIDGIENQINPIIKEFYDEIKSRADLTGNLYQSLNSKLYSSIDYITNDGNEYSSNPVIPYYIYYNLIPSSLNFELLIPFNTIPTHMTLCSNDFQNGCKEDYLIPFVYSYPEKNGKICDPLFNISDVKSIINAK